jgi:hypothetical protein
VLTIVLTNIILCVPLMIIESSYALVMGMSHSNVVSMLLMMWKFVVRWERFPSRMHNLFSKRILFWQEKNGKGKHAWAKVYKDICLSSPSKIEDLVCI